MSNQPTSILRQLKWRLECLAYSAVEMVAGLLPGLWVHRVGEALGGLAWHLMRHRRQMVERNLRIAYAGEKDSREIRALAKATMRRAGANLVSAAYTARLSPRQLSKILHIENLELLRESLDKGRGVVLLLAHMGNWELLSRLIYLLPEGTKTGAFYRPLNNPILDRQVLARRQADGTRMFSKRDPFHQVAGFLREGGIVGVLADQRVGGNGDLVQFFGRLTRASPLPSLLARRAKCDMAALSLVTESPGRWKATLLPVEKPYSTKHSIGALESAMRLSPRDVFWLQERWKVRLDKGHGIKYLLGEEAGDGRKPHRALLWLVDDSESWDTPESWVHPDVVYEVALAPGKSLPPSLPEGTRMHEVENGLNRSRYENAIARIDESEELPLDYILTEEINRDIFQACRKLSIPVFSATWKPVRG